MLPLTLWRVTRLSLDYLLDSIELSRAGGDVVDRLLLAAIIDANVAPIKQDPELQFAYGALEAAPPEDVRRPVSINAIAQSLGLPFETVRRRVRRLSRAGTCLITPAGLLAPQAVLATPEFKAMSLARYERLKRFYLDLRAVDALPPMSGDPVAAAHPPVDGPPVRAVNRLLAEHLMRFIEAVMRRIPDPLAGLALLELVRANTEHLSPTELEATIPVRDSDRRPIPVAHLARRLNLAPETLRRRVLLLEQEGYCVRTPEGLVVRSAGLARPGVLSLILENAANVRRLFWRLDRLGVLAAWDREAATHPGDRAS